MACIGAIKTCSGGDFRSCFQFAPRASLLHPPMPEAAARMQNTELDMSVLSDPKRRIRKSGDEELNLIIAAARGSKIYTLTITVITKEKTAKSPRQRQIPKS